MKWTLLTITVANWNSDGTANPDFQMETEDVTQRQQHNGNAKNENKTESEKTDINVTRVKWRYVRK